MSAICAWSNMFDDTEREIVYNGLVLTGIAGVICSAWVSMTILMSNLKNDRSYKNLANFTLAQYIRRAIWLTTRLVLPYYFESLANSHELLAFMDTFLDVMEIETLTHVCIERYVLTKYLIKGRQVKKEHYSLFLHLSFLFSALYSIPPLFGLGRYGYDYTCDTFTFDMVLPNTWQDSLVISMFLLRSVKPCIFMAFMLSAANSKDVQIKMEDINFKQMEFTKAVIALAIVTVTYSIPVFLVRGLTVLCIKLNNEIIIPPLWHVKYAFWIHWATPVATTFTLYMWDDELRMRMTDFRTFLFMGEKKPIKPAQEVKEE